MNHSQIVTLTPRHLKILDLCLQGWRNKDIARHLDMGQTQVSVITNSPSFQHEFAMRRHGLEERFDDRTADNIDEATAELQRSAADAARKLVSGLASVNELIVLKSANDILDRTGHAKVVQENKTITNVNISEDDSKRIVDALLLDKDI